LHPKDPLKSLIDQLFASTNFGWCYLTIGPVTTLGSRLDRREVLMVAVAIATKEKLLDSSPLSQANCMLTKKLARGPD
jgi:hypothetical protein